MVWVEAVLLLYIDLRALFDVFPHTDIGFECTVYVGSSSWICVMQEPSAQSQTTLVLFSSFYGKLKNLKKSCHIKFVRNMLNEDVSEPNTDKRRMANVCLQSSSMLGTIFNTIETSAQPLSCC